MMGMVRRERAKVGQYLEISTRLYATGSPMRNHRLIVSLANSDDHA
jgi:hypothetical protein